MFVNDIPTVTKSGSSEIVKKVALIANFTEKKKQ